MPKKKHLTDADFHPENIKIAKRIMAYAKDVLGNNNHEAHLIACLELFKVHYMSKNMTEVRSYISHVAAIAKEKHKTDNLVALLNHHLAERLKEIQPTLHPEDEQHLLLVQQD